MRHLSSQRDAPEHMQTQRDAPEHMQITIRRDKLAARRSC
jgi:hypothetical protein